MQVTRAMLDTNDVFIFDCVAEVRVMGVCVLQSFTAS
jgi:hypothetical protein